MYLLNREYGWNDAGGAAAFTFHYVSIKSKLDGEGVYTGANLHSTMYLLNPVSQHLIIFQAYSVFFCRPTIIQC